MKKKVLGVVLSATVAAGLLGGCASNNSSDGKSNADTSKAADSGSKSDAGYTGEIELMHFSTAEEENSKNGGAAGLRHTVGVWEENNKGIKLNQNVLANKEYKEKISTLAAAGDLPDVFLVQGMNTASWSKQELILDLTDYIKASPYAAKYDNSKFYAFTADGKQYAIPALVDGTCAIVSYDKEAWTKAGYPNFPETWEEMKKAEASIKEQGFDYAISFGNSEKWQINSCFMSTVGDRFTGADWTYSLIENTGSAFTDKAFVDSLKWTQSIFQSGIFNPDFNAINNNGSNDYYIAGQSAATIGGNWDVSYIYTNAEPDLVERTGFAVIPQPEGATGSTKTHDTGMGYGFAINPKVSSDPAKLAACVDLIYELTGIEFANYVAENFALAGVTKADEVDLSKFDQFTQDFYNFYKNPGVEIYDSYINSAVIDVLNTDLQTMLNGDISPEDVAKNAQAKYAEIYKK